MAASRPSPPKPHERLAGGASSLSTSTAAAAGRMTEFDRARTVTGAGAAAFPASSPAYLGSPSTSSSSFTTMGTPSLPPRPGVGGYGSVYGASSSMVGSRYGSTGYGYGSSYGSGYGGYGSSYGGYSGSRYGSGYGSRYGSYGGGYGAYGGGYGGGYGSYGGGYGAYGRGQPLGARGQPGAEGGPAVVSWIDQFAQVVDTFGRFAHLLDMNCDALYGSFSSVLRLFESMSELRRELFFIFQTVTLYRFLKAALGRLGVGKLLLPGPAEATSSPSTGLDLDSFQHFQGKASDLAPRRRLWPFLLFLISAIGGPLLINRLWRMLRAAAVSPEPQLLEQDQSASPLWVQALYDFTGSGSEGDLTFNKGAMIRVLRSDPDQGWWEGETGGRIGLFPANFVQPAPYDGGTSSSSGAAWLPENGEEPIRLHLNRPA